MSAGNEIGDLLLDIGLITPEELATAHEEQTKSGERLTLVLERLGLLSYHQLKDALELQFGVNFYSLSKTPPVKEVADLLGLNTKYKHRVVPVAWAGTQFTIAMVNPDDLIALDAVRVELKSGHLKKVVCTADEFEFFMRDTYESPQAAAAAPLSTVEAATAAEPATAVAVSMPAPSAPPALAKPGVKVPKGHLQSLFADDDDDDFDDDDDDIPLPTVQPSRKPMTVPEAAPQAAIPAPPPEPLAPEPLSPEPIPPAQPIPSPSLPEHSELSALLDAVLLNSEPATASTPAPAPEVAPAPPVGVASIDDAPILKIEPPAVDVVSAVLNADSAVAPIKETDKGAENSGSLPEAFKLDLAKSLGLDDDDDDTDMPLIPLPTVQPKRKPQEVASEAPAAVASPVAASLEAPAIKAADVPALAVAPVEAPVASVAEVVAAPAPVAVPAPAPLVETAGPMVPSNLPVVPTLPSAPSSLPTNSAAPPIPNILASRKPAASVTAHTLPALNRDMMLSPMAAQSVVQDSVVAPPSTDNNQQSTAAVQTPVSVFSSSTGNGASLPTAEYNIEEVVASVAEHLVESIESNKSFNNDASRQLLEEVVESELGGMEDTDINKLKEQQNSSIMLLAHEIIGKATQKRCSDIHLEPDASGVTLRYFLHGELLADCVLPGEIHQALVSSYKIIAGLDPNELQKPQDKKIVTRVEEDRVELRITTLPSDHGEMVAISMRFLGQES